MEFLYEKHNMLVGDKVIVYRRDSPDETFEGEIYKIEYKKMDGNNNSDYIHHFYIEFPLEIYDKLLKRGSKVYYKHCHEIIGDVFRNKTTEKIEKIFIQYLFQTYEPEIDMKYVNSMLIWRAAYNIVKK